MTHRTFTAGLGVVGIAAALTIGWVHDARAHDLDAKFQKMDTNGDGKLSADEHAAGTRAMFQEMDTNGDGKVTAAEMDAFHNRQEAVPATNKMEKPVEKAQKGVEMTSVDKIKMMDTNGDGLLSADEHAAGARMMFDRSDVNHDGFLSKAEFKAAHARMMVKAPKS